MITPSSSFLVIEVSSSAEFTGLEWLLVRRPMNHSRLLGCASEPRNRITARKVIAASIAEISVFYLKASSNPALLFSSERKVPKARASIFWQADG
jgi:hypothetical protein